MNVLITAACRRLWFGIVVAFQAVRVAILGEPMPSKEALSVMANWVAAIADSVKNPIAGIGAVLDHVEDHLLEPAVVATSLAQVRKRLANLNEYVTELSDFARPASFLASEINVKVLINEALLAAELPSSWGVTVVVPAKLAFHLDVIKMRFVLKGLIRNAFEATGAVRTPQIRISACGDGTSGIKISIEDNGPGIDPQIVAFVTEPFFTTKEAGTGLGLAIAHKYAEAGGGNLSIGRSRALGGCAVVITLPGVTLDQGGLK